MSFGKVLAFGLKGATALGGVATGATLGEVILKRVGLMKKETYIVPELAHAVLDIAGVAKETRPALGASSVIPANVRVVCPMCSAIAKQPILAGAAGEEFRIVRCEGHEVAAGAVLDTVESLYLGYAEALGVDGTELPKRGDYRSQLGNVEEYPYLQDLGEWRTKLANTRVDIGKFKPSDCGPKPSKDAFQYTGGYEKWMAATMLWQDCQVKAYKGLEEEAKAATKKAAKAEAKEDADAVKAKKDAVAAQKKADKEGTAKAVADANAKNKKVMEHYQKTAAAALAFTKKKAEEQIATLETAQAKKETDAEKAAMQTQIDELKQQSQLASQLAAETSQKAMNEAQQAKIDQLQMLIASKGTESGGMADLLRIAMQSQAQQSQMAPAVPWQAIPQFIPQQYDPGYSQQPQPQYQQQYSEQPYFADDYAQQTGFDFQGAANIGDVEFEMLDDDVADYLGFPSGATNFEGSQVFAMKQLGYSDEDLAAFFDADGDGDAVPGLSGCGIGACGRVTG